MDDNCLPALWGRANVDTLAQLTGAHPTTARRWKRLKALPRWLAILVRVVLEGELADVSAEFAGWCIRHGELVSPEGSRFTPGQIRALPILRQQLVAYRVSLLHGADHAHDHIPERSEHQHEHQRGGRAELGRLAEPGNHAPAAVAHDNPRMDAKRLG
jgi:hypothetical protein